MKNNRVMLIGYVGKDLVAQPLPNGGKRIGLRIATHYVIKNDKGEKLYQTVWHDVTAWDRIAEYAEKSFVKGCKIMVDGSIEYRTYPDNTGFS